jgi:cytochrome c oxidase subunit 4
MDHEMNLPIEEEQEQQIEAHTPYMKVFWTLLVFTILEYGYAMLAQGYFPILVAGLMVLALTKATLVGMFFMHLKFEGPWVYAFLAPAAFLAVTLVLMLVPDIAMKADRLTDPTGTPPPKPAPLTPGESHF